MLWVLIFVLLAFWAGRLSVPLTQPPTSRLRGHIDATFDEAERRMMQSWWHRRPRRSDDGGEPTVIDQ